MIGCFPIASIERGDPIVLQRYTFVSSSALFSIMPIFM